MLFEKTKKLFLKNHALKLRLLGKRVTYVFPEIETALIKWFETNRTQNAKCPFYGGTLE